MDLIRVTNDAHPGAFSFPSSLAIRFSTPPVIQTGDY